jgi:dethiobiotin synthetase
MTRGRLVVVTGTGTGIGKTHFCVALLRALATHFDRVTGTKPVETGVADPRLSDAARLATASSFHVQHSGYFYADPVSPHLAARRSGDVIDLGRLSEIVSKVRMQTSFALVELAGGLFSPLTDTALNADWVALLEPDATLLVAPDRLGVLHEVLSTTRAAQSMSVAIAATVLSEPPQATQDASTGLNSLELHGFLSMPVYALPRLTADALARDPSVMSIAASLAR